MSEAEEQWEEYERAQRAVARHVRERWEIDEREIRLDQERFAILQTVSAGVLGDLSFAKDLVSNALVIRLERTIYTHKLAEWDQYTEIPANWWQHLRATLGLKYRVARRAFTITRRHLYPDLPVLPAGSAGVSYIQEETTSGPR